MASPFDRIDNLISEIGISIVVNALQQVCFTKAYEEKAQAGGDTKTQRLYYDTGMALDKAVRTVNI